jgi:hypothetical protein
MTEQGRPTGIQYEDAADAAMHGGSVDFEGRKVRVLSLNSVAERDAVAVNATRVEIASGGAAAFIEDATKYSIFGRR